MPARANVSGSASFVLAFRFLQFALAALMVGAGADKYFQGALNWNQYVPPFVPWALGSDVSSFVAGVGVFEVALGLGLVFSPILFGALVSLWLLFMNMNLIASGNFLQVSVLDLALAIAAFALSTLGRIPEIHFLHQSRPRRSLLPSRKNLRFRPALWRPAH